MGDEDILEVDEVPESESLQAQTWETVSDGTRLDVQLASVTGLTRSRVASLIDEGRCSVSGKVVRKAGMKPKTGERVTLTDRIPVPATPQPENIPLTILYEDEALAVVFKPCGMVVHPAPGNETGTMVNALLYHIRDLSGIGGELRPGIVHRLDKDTSGLLLVAKCDAAQTELSRQLSAREMEKHYLALVEGGMKEASGFVNAPLARAKNDRKKMAIDPEGREALTEWRVLAQGRACTLMDVHILTGRTHQIRVHMKSLGHPVCGDPIYGSGRGLKVPRLMLHAHSLAFTHPVSGERMTFTCPVPAAFVEGMRKNGVDLGIISELQMEL